MKRFASIVLLIALLGVALSPLLAQVQPSHPAACPRVANAKHCHGGVSPDNAPAIKAQAADCPMRCCPTLRGSAAFSPAAPVVIATLASISFESPAQPISVFLSAPQVHFERGPPLA